MQGPSQARVSGKLRPKRHRILLRRLEIGQDLTKASCNLIDRSDQCKRHRKQQEIEEYLLLLCCLLWCESFATTVHCPRQETCDS